MHNIDLMLNLKQLRAGIEDNETGDFHSLQDVVEHLVTLGYRDFHGGHLEACWEDRYKYICLEVAGYPDGIRDVCWACVVTPNDVVAVNLDDFLNLAAEYAKGEQK